MQTTNTLFSSWKTCLLTVCVVVVGFSVATNPVLAETASDCTVSGSAIAEKTFPSSVFIESAVAQGSGFVVGEGLVATNFHVIGDAQALTVRIVGSEKKDSAISSKENVISSITIDRTERKEEGDTKALYDLGVAYAKSERFEKAITYFTTVISALKVSDELKANAFRSRGLVYERIGDLANAIADFSSAISVTNASSKTKANAFYNRGISYGERGDILRKISDFSTAIELLNGPSELKAEILYNRGIAYGRHGRISEAIKDYSTIIETPNLPTQQIINALNNRGVTYEMNGNVVKAIEDYSSLIAMSDVPMEKKAMTFNNRGAALGKRGKVGDAISDFTSVINMVNVAAEQKAKALCNRGLTYFTKGEPEKAIKDCDAVLTMQGAPTETKTAAHNIRKEANEKIRQNKTKSSLYKPTATPDIIVDERNQQNEVNENFSIRRIDLDGRATIAIPTNFTFSSKEELSAISLSFPQKVQLTAFLGHGKENKIRIAIYYYDDDGLPTQETVNSMSEKELHNFGAELEKADQIVNKRLGMKTDKWRGAAIRKINNFNFIVIERTGSIIPLSSVCRRDFFGYNGKKSFKVNIRHTLNENAELNKKIADAILNSIKVPGFDEAPSSISRQSLIPSASVLEKQFFDVFANSPKIKEIKNELGEIIKSAEKRQEGMQSNDEVSGKNSVQLPATAEKKLTPSSAEVPDSSGAVIVACVFVVLFFFMLCYVVHLKYVVQDIEKKLTKKDIAADTKQQTVEVDNDVAPLQTKISVGQSDRVSLSSDVPDTPESEQQHTNGHGESLLQKSPKLDFDNRDLHQDISCNAAASEFVAHESKDVEVRTLPCATPLHNEKESSQSILHQLKIVFVRYWLSWTIIPVVIFFWCRLRAMNDFLRKRNDFLRHEQLGFSNLDQPPSLSEVYYFALAMVFAYSVILIFVLFCVALSEYLKHKKTEKRRPRENDLKAHQRK